MVAGAPAGTVAWLRSTDGEHILVAVNMDDEAHVVPTGGPGEVLLATDSGSQLVDGTPDDVLTDATGFPIGIRLVADSAVIVKLT